MLEKTGGLLVANGPNLTLTGVGLKLTDDFGPYTKNLTFKMKVMSVTLKIKYKIKYKNKNKK